MLKKATKYEKKIMEVLIMMLVVLLFCLIVDRSIIDIIYILIVSYYFGRFLIIKNRR